MSAYYLDNHKLLNYLTIGSMLDTLNHRIQTPPKSATGTTHFTAGNSGRVTENLYGINKPCEDINKPWETPHMHYGISYIWLKLGIHARLWQTFQNFFLIAFVDKHYYYITYSSDTQFALRQVFYPFPCKIR